MEPFFYIGILVTDFDETIADFGGGIHHVGLWGPDLEKTLSASERFQMLHIEATLPNKATHAVTSMSAPLSLHGVRLELIDERRRSGIEAWINRGNFES
jgi:hypothetical protein